MADELPPDDRVQVARHLAVCHHCRQTAQELRATVAALREAPVPELPGDLLERVLARRAAGERVILPTALPAPAARRAKPWLAALAAGVVLALVGSLAVFRTPDLAASASELTISPREVRAGQRIHVEYRATPKLSGEARLVLRARLATRNSTMVYEHAEVGVLARQAGGIYRGTLTLPDSVVYAAFAVEDTSGTRVDYNPAEWDLLVHGADGRPLLAALEQQTDYRDEWNTELAMETAWARTELYPDSSGGWLTLFHKQESAAQSQESRDSLNAVYGERFRTLERQYLSRPRLEPGEMSWLYFFASALDDTAAARRWADRLIATYPRHIAGVQLRVFRIGDEHRGDRPQFLTALERLWDEVGSTSSQLMFTGFSHAQMAGDEAEIERWGNRLLAAEPMWRAWVTRAFAEAPGLRSQALGLLRTQLQSMDSAAPSQRPLGQSVDEYRRGLQSAKGFFLGQHGRALLADGQQQAALDTLARAVELAWSVDLQRALAEARLVVGDTSRALAAFARVAADPTTSLSFADSVRGRTGHRFQPALWAEAVAAGRQEMAAFIWAQAVDRDVRGAIRLTDPEGRVRVFEKESAGPTFVAFWSRYCPPSFMQLDQLQQLSQELSRAGVRVLSITEGERPAELGEFLKEKGYTFPALIDADHYAARAFDNRATPRYLVLDGSGRIRFDSHTLGDVIRQIFVLRESP